MTETSAQFYNKGMLKHSIYLWVFFSLLVSCSGNIDLSRIELDQSTARIQSTGDPKSFLVAPIPHEKTSIQLSKIPVPLGASLFINSQWVESKVYQIEDLSLGQNILTLEYRRKNGAIETYKLDCYRSLPVFRSTPQSYGLPVDEPRFFSSHRGTLTDRKTGLTWVDDGKISDFIPGEEMRHWIEEFNRGERGDNRGFSDWRIPNRKEMRSLHYFHSANGSEWLNERGFRNMQGTYWSYNQSNRTGEYAETWTVLLNNVHAPQLVFNRNGSFLLPVRGEGILPVTGELPGPDNGGKIWGKAWPEIRFTDRGDGTQVDNMTGLIWMKDTSVSGLLDYPDAEIFLKEFNKKSSPGNRGYTDWRMPTVDELETMTHMGVEDGRIWLEEQGFENVKSQYKSETASVGSGNYHMTLLPFNGLIVHNFDDLEHMVWLVRGP